jgi:hypothetical protein
MAVLTARFVFFVPGIFQKSPKNAPLENKGKKMGGACFFSFFLGGRAIWSELARGANHAIPFNFKTEVLDAHWA